MKRILLAALVIGLVAILGFGTYTQLYLPSTRTILTGSPLVAAGKLEKLTAEPLSSQPPDDQERFSAALRDAVAAIEPDQRIEAEELYLRRGGYDWAAVRNFAGGYLDGFGFSESAAAQTEVDGQTVDYLVWRPDWLHSIFDDRTVIAVALRSLLQPDGGTMVFGYFVLQPR